MWGHLRRRASDTRSTEETPSWTSSLKESTPSHSAPQRCSNRTGWSRAISRHGCNSSNSPSPRCAQFVSSSSIPSHGGRRARASPPRRPSSARGLGETSASCISRFVSRWCHEYSRRLDGARSSSCVPRHPAKAGYHSTERPTSFPPCSKWSDVASLAHGGAALQRGIGRLPDVALRRMHGRGSLGVWSEMISDRIMEFDHVVTNEWPRYPDVVRMS